MNIAYLWVALGGALGSVLRFWVNELVLQRTGSSFPWGILIINVTGSFLIGIFAAFTDPEAAAEKIPSNVPFVVANNGAQIAANYALEGDFALAVIGRDGNLDLNSAKVVPVSRIMDMVINNAEQQAAERPKASAGMLAAGRFYNPADKRAGR